MSQGLIAHVSYQRDIHGKHYNSNTLKCGLVCCIKRNVKMLMLLETKETSYTYTVIS